MPRWTAPPATTTASAGCGHPPGARDGRPNSTPSLTVAASTGAILAESTVDRHGRSLIRYRIDV